MEKCAECGKRGEPSAIKRCSRCKTVRYCSTQCQSRAWPRHKVTCGESSVDGHLTGAANKGAQTSHSTSPSQTTATTANPFASLFDGTFYQTPWQKARSRAEEAFPGLDVTDNLTGDLDLTEQEVELEDPFPFVPFGLPFLPFPFNVMAGGPTVISRIRATCGKVLVIRLVHGVLFPPFVVWLTEDVNGNQIHVFFEIESPIHYFRASDLQAGNFLCIKRAALRIQVQRVTGGIILRDPSFVRVFKF